MSPTSDTAAMAAPVATPAARVSPFAAFAWSVRREIWEHRSLYIAPLAVAGLVLFGAIISAVKVGGRLHAQLEAAPDQAAVARLAAFGASAVAMLFVAEVVAVFYCLAAVNGERRDRSILFWKSLPVSDASAVLAKAAIPMAVLPVFLCALIIGLQTLLLMIGTVGALIKGEPGLMSGPLRLPEMWGLLVYAVVAVTLWYAPIYGWLLMVSAWSKRAPFLWAVLPPLALTLVERLTFGTDYVGGLLNERFGGFKVAFQDGSGAFRGRLASFGNPLAIADPAGLVSSPGLWGGLVAAAVFIGATVWLRQNRDPV